MSSAIHLATSSASVNNGSTRVLFVEGTAHSIDVEVVSALLKEVDITVRPLKSSLSLRTCADAFSPLEPGYFFLIDRDYHCEESVNESWDNFKKGHSNLLIWRKKEIENYFLNPAFLLQSKFINTNASEDALKEVIIKEANKRIFQLAANQTIIQIREELRKKWIKCFDNLQGFDSEENAIKRLLEREEFSNQEKKSSKYLNSEQVKSIFKNILEGLTGGEIPLKWNCGRWLDFIQAKPILNQLICNGSFFVNRISGMSEELDEKNKEIVILTNLVQTSKKLPDDFVELKKVMQLIATQSFLNNTAA